MKQRDCMWVIVCVWAAAACAGCAGEKGDKGDPGAPGISDGGTTSSAGGKIVASLFCTGRLENTTSSFSYTAVLFENGNIYADGSVHDGLNETTGSAFYSPTQVGAESASVFFTRDGVGTPNGGFFKISLNRTSLVTTIEYSDNEATGGKLVWTMPASACVANAY